MKLNKETLKRIIKEELEAVLDESALLKKFKAKKENELMKKFKDMGKKPRKTFNDLRSHSPDQLASIGQAFDPAYPGRYAGTPATAGAVGASSNKIVPNPYGGRFFYMFEPEDFVQRTGKADQRTGEVGPIKKGSISLFSYEPASGDMEFANAYAVEDLDKELKRVANLR
jgi:hypothetical protein